jgi:hypothetical protein
MQNLYIGINGDNIEDNLIEDSGMAHLCVGNWIFLERIKLSKAIFILGHNFITNEGVKCLEGGNWSKLDYLCLCKNYKNRRQPH